MTKAMLNSQGECPHSVPDYEKEHIQILRTLRCLVVDLCQQFDGGHPGGAMSMGAIGLALYKYSMRYSPLNPSYFNRDRLVLSNGHTCLWQYIFMHLAGFQEMTLEQLKSYHSNRPDSLCPGHPQIQHQGIDATTGPLGQGVANAVGLAVASKNLSATYNRPGFELVDNMTWCTIGDACLQEGVALEAIQLAGHWKLNNLAVLYDNNQITCDGSVDVTCSEDINAKMRACGWSVIDVLDGSQDVEAVVQALTRARANTSQPTFVNVHTIIGIGSAVEGQAIAHGAPLGVEGVALVKTGCGMNTDDHFKIDPNVYVFFDDTIAKGQQHEAEFEDRLCRYEHAYPLLAEEFRLRINGEMRTDWRSLIPKRDCFPEDKISSRKSAALIIAALAKNINSIMVGTANLRASVNMTWDAHVSFQQPGLVTACGQSGDYTGRYMHCGIREHAMASIANGLAAYNRGTFLPVTSGFFMFYLYAAPGVRMGAIQGLQCIHLATHDSIAVGEDGPAHQPIELAALFRAMPNLLYIRPCDSEETCGAFTIALEAGTTPTMISLSRHALIQYPHYSKREGSMLGAYVFIEEEEADVTLIGVGAEISFAVDARTVLRRADIKARVVSFPCQRLFDIQTPAYREYVMQYGRHKPVIIIESYAANGWERYADAGYSMNSFGKSFPAGEEIYKFFNFDAEVIAASIRAFLCEVESVGVRTFEGISES